VSYYQRSAHLEEHLPQSFLPDEAAQSRREATPAGWAIVDNTIGEDWKDVHLSLVAGAPQSFVENISQPFYARRPRFHCTVCSAYAAITRGYSGGRSPARAPPPPARKVAPGQRLVVPVVGMGSGSAPIALGSGQHDAWSRDGPKWRCRPGARQRAERFGFFQSTNADASGHYVSTCPSDKRELRSTPPASKPK